MRFFGLKSCDTCRKALVALRAAGHAPEVIDLRTDGVGADDLAAILAAYPEAAINRASTTWRGLSENERARPPAALLAAHPALMKRPVIETGGQWHLGWSSKVQTAIIGAR